MMFPILPCLQCKLLFMYKKNQVSHFTRLQLGIITIHYNKCNCTPRCLQGVSAVGLSQLKHFKSSVSHVEGLHSVCSSLFAEGHLGIRLLWQADAQAEVLNVYKLPCMVVENKKQCKNLNANTYHTLLRDLCTVTILVPQLSCSSFEVGWLLTITPDCLICSYPAIYKLVRYLGFLITLVTMLQAYN